MVCTLHQAIRCKYNKKYFAQNDCVMFFLRIIIHDIYEININWVKDG